MNKALILHFIHPEAYPPALNAINCFAEKFDSVEIITTDTFPTDWKYKKNVKISLVEGEHDRFKFSQKSPIIKLKRYLIFLLKIRKAIKNTQPKLVVIYDNVPFFLYLLAVLFLRKKHLLWYHNHDIYPQSKYPKYSILWFSFIAIQRFFNRIDIFTIPAMERVKMFPMSRFQGKFYFIPNYPSKKIIYSEYNYKTPNSAKGNDQIKLIYPGSPSKKNGFEELIIAAKSLVNGKKISITIVGEPNAEFRKELENFARYHGVESQLYFEERVSYVKMPQFLKNYHIGWAMYKPQDMRTATVGTASNKIYEFLANGMPILVFDNEHHRKHLSKTKATFFTDLTPDSIINNLKIIDSEYDTLSKEARKEFEEKYQFENHFNDALNEVYHSMIQEN